MCNCVYIVYSVDNAINRRKDGTGGHISSYLPSSNGDVCNISDSKRVIISLSVESTRLIFK